jgi:hypothetical protein
MPFERLGTVPATELTAAREHAHWAVQVPAAVGQSMIGARPDDSHTSLRWSSALGAFVGPGVELADGLAVGVCLRNLSLLVLEREQVQARLSLAFHSLEGALSWTRARLQERAAQPLAALERPSYDMPGQPPSEAAPFQAPADALTELARWYDAADSVLQRFVIDDPQRGAVLAWPHHFDLASLWLLVPGGDPRTTPQIGVGLSPGDGSYAEPYFYVTAWPHREPPSPQALEGGGHWHTEGFVGAILRGSILTREASAGAQQQALDAFIKSALSGAQALVAAAS